MVRVNGFDSSRDDLDFLLLGFVVLGQSYNGIWLLSLLVSSLDFHSHEFWWSTSQYRVS